MRKIYYISHGYRTLVIWACDPKTQRRVSVRHVAPVSGMARIARYNVIADALAGELIAVPPYKPTGSV